MSQNKKKLCYVDRDGTIIQEPADEQIDSFEKFALVDGAIPALLKIQQAGYQLIMISNQDGLGTASYAQEDYDKIQTLLMQILSSQGVHFHEVRICPHFDSDHCECRKPKLGLVEKDLVDGVLDAQRSVVIGDRQTDVDLAKRLKIRGFLLSDTLSWEQIATEIVDKPRTAKVTRHTNETRIDVSVNLDQPGHIDISSGIGFFDHMLEQIAKHGGMSCQLRVSGDLHIDDHHTVEDTALALGTALKQALGDKLGIHRYGFLLPMDETLCEIAIDLSGRPYFVFDGKFSRDSVGELSTELVPHFFQSLSHALQMNCHLKVQGENTHHMVESCFKAFGRVWRMAANKVDGELPSTKGAL